MHEVFISYPHQDKKYADAICHYLEEAGIRCWYAPRDILTGAVWAESIHHAIEESRVLVLVYSKYAARSVHIKKELALARENGLRILPFQVGKVGRDGKGDAVDGADHWLDAMNRSLHAALDLLHQTVCAYTAVEYRKVEQVSRLTSKMVKVSHRIRYAAIAVRDWVMDDVADYIKGQDLMKVLLLFFAAGMIGLFLYMAARYVYMGLRFGLWT